MHYIEKAKRTDPQHAVLTSSHGTTSSMCALMSSRERSFHLNGMTFLHSAVLRLGPHPGWCLGFQSIPPLRFQTLSKTQKQTNSLLCHAKCCHTSAATVELWRPPQNWIILRTCGALQAFLVFYSLTHLFWLFHNLFLLPFFPTSAYFSVCVLYVFSRYVWIRVSFNESISFFSIHLSVLYCVVSCSSFVFVSFFCSRRNRTLFFSPSLLWQSLTKMWANCHFWLKPISVLLHIFHFSHGFY